MCRFFSFLIATYFFTLTAFAQNCTPNSPVTVQGANPSRDGFQSLFEQHRAKYSDNEVQNLKNSITNCNNAMEVELRGIENQQRELSGKMRDVIACKDIENLQKRIETLRSSRKEVKEEAENAIRNIKTCGIYAVVLDDIDEYANKNIHMDNCRYSLTAQAIEDLIGTTISRTTSVVNLSEVKDVIRSFTGGSLRVDKVILDKANFNFRRFYYIAQISVTPQKTTASQNGRNDFNAKDALIIDIMNNYDWKKQLENKGANSNDIAAIENEVQNLKARLPNENQNAENQLKAVAKANEEEIKKIEKDIIEAEAKIKQKIQQLKKIATSLGLYINENQATQSFNDILQQIRTKNNELDNKWRNVKSKEIVFKPTDIVIEGTPAESFAEGAEKICKQLKKQYGNVQRTTEIIEVENFQTTNYETSKVIEVERKLVQTWAYPVPNGSSFVLFLFARFDVQSNSSSKKSNSYDAVNEESKKIDTHCSSLINVNKVVNGLPVVYTSKVSLVVRGNYSYSIEFSNDDKGIIGRVTSIAGDEINQDDNVVFVNPANEKKTFRFTSLGEIVKSGINNGKINTLQLDLAAIEWLAANEITGFYVINNIKHQMQKITLLPIRTQEFKDLTTCFLHSMDKSQIKNIKSSEVY